MKKTLVALEKNNGSKIGLVSKKTKRGVSCDKLAMKTSVLAALTAYFDGYRVKDSQVFF